MSKWCSVGCCVKGKCLEENAELAGGDLVKAMMAKFDTTGEEKIVVDGIIACCAACGCDVTAEEAAAMIAEADKDEDGSIDAFEFETILSTYKCV